MKNKITVALLLSLLCMSVYAKRVEEEKAVWVAKYLVERQFDKKVTGDELTLVYTAKDNSLLESHVVYYIFNVGDGGGFIIVAGDDIACPILGYSTEGSYRHENLPPNFEAWMADIADAIVKGIKDNVSGDTQIQEEWGAYLNRDEDYFAKTRSEGAVNPLIQTKWDQMDPYWNQCPTFNGARCLTGCVATSMAQIMKYHNHPTTGTGSSPAYTTTTNQISVPSVNFNVNYNFNDMGNVSPTTSSAQNNVARLMYHCGASVKMNYGPEWSGAYSKDVITAITTYFGYDKSATLVYKQSYTDAQWTDLLKQELNANRPLYYAGNNQTYGGHAFVCDGYDTNNLFHFNWGWSGQEDGYYAINPMPSDFFPLYNEACVGWKPTGGTGSCSSATNLAVNYTTNCEAQLTWSPPGKGIAPSCPPKGEWVQIHQNSSNEETNNFMNVENLNSQLSILNSPFHLSSYSEHFGKPETLVETTESRDGWLNWCGNNADAMGTGQPVSFIVAARYTPSDLAGLGIVSGNKVTKIAFLPWFTSGITFTVGVYQGATSPNNPGNLVYEQMVTQSLMAGQYNEITLTTPVTINASQELWIAYLLQITQYNQYPAGCDAGPRVTGKGDLMFINGSWGDLYTLSQGKFNVNWNIGGYIETGGTPPPPPPPSDCKYNVYRDGMLVAGNISQTSYTDTGFSTNQGHTWSVKVACEGGGESVAVSVTKTSCIPTAIEPVAGANDYSPVQVYPNPTTGEWHIVVANNDSFIQNIEIYDVLGRVVEVTHLPLRGGLGGLLPAGVYFMRIQTENEILMRKVIKK